MTGVIFYELALTCYFTATIISIIDIFKSGIKSYKLTVYIVTLGFALHSISIIYRYILAGYIPITSMHEASSFFAWSITLVYLFLYYNYRLKNFGSFILPIVFLIMLFSSILSREIKSSVIALQSYWFGIHTVLAFLSNAFFAIACGIGIMYMLQEHYVKIKKPKLIFKELPSLEELDELNYSLISIGFPLLTLAIISGAIWANTAWGGFWSWDNKEIWAVITWLIYGLALHLRLVPKWRGKKLAILSIIGFIFVLVGFFGVNLFFKTLHKF